MSEMSRSPLSSRPFFERVESLRGVGALAVAGFHFSGCVLNGITILPQVPWKDSSLFQRVLGQIAIILLPGRAAVLAFFVISGLVLRVALEYGPDSTPKASAKFLIARFFRFFPIVAVLAIITALAFSSGEFHTRHFIATLFLFDVSNFTHLWAIQVELLMGPVILILYFLERGWGPKVLAIVAVTTTGLSFARHWAVWPPLSTHLFAFALGMLIPTYGRRFAAALAPRTATRWFSASLVLFLAAGPLLGEYSKFATIIEAYSSAAAITLIAYRSDLRILRALDSRWLRMLGSASGSYYVLHMLTVPVVMTAAVAIIPKAWSDSAPGVIGVGLIAIWLVAIAPPMIGVSRLVEMPGIALGRRVVRFLRLDSRPRILPIGAAIPARKAA